jgi:hypothetical protein
MVVLIFLSRGYFCSRNCLREVRACKEQKKPILLVHETDDTKGGLTIEEAREECPEVRQRFHFAPTLQRAHRAAVPGGEEGGGALVEYWVRGVIP